MNQLSPSLIERERRSFLQTYKRLPVEIDRAEGMYVYARDGARYLDFLGGIAVNAAGHSHPRIIEAVERQIRRYAHVSNFFYQDVQVELVEKLLRLGGYDRAFLGNSGSEATDGAIKLARAWGSASGRTTVIGFTGGFHGRGYGALSIMDKPKYKEGMGPFLPDATILPFNDAAALREGVDGSTAAIFIEYVQGENGVREASPEFVQAIEELRREHGFLVVADEVQGGCGRTGRFFSFEHPGVRPDVVTVAKVLGGGLPLSAILTTEGLADVWSVGRHGTTFGGNAIACAAGGALLDMIEEGLMEHVAESGAYMLAKLRELQEEIPDTIVDVRGRGAFVGVELAVPAGPVVEMLLERRVIANSTAETTIRLLPPFIFEREHVDELIDALRYVLCQ